MLHTVRFDGLGLMSINVITLIGAKIGSYKIMTENSIVELNLLILLYGSVLKSETFDFAHNFKENSI